LTIYLTIYVEIIYNKARGREKPVVGRCRGIIADNIHVVIFKVGTTIKKSAI